MRNLFNNYMDIFHVFAKIFSKSSAVDLLMLKRIFLITNLIDWIVVLMGIYQDIHPRGQFDNCEKNN